MVIESPGPWVTGIDVEEVRAGHSKTRNRAIARNLHELDYIEERGTFWGKALTAHEERGYPLPTFEDIGHSLRVILPIHPAAAGTPASPESGPGTARRRRMTREERFAQFEEFLAAGPLSTAQIAALAGITARGACEVLLDMQIAGDVGASPGAL